MKKITSRNIIIELLKGSEKEKKITKQQDKKRHYVQRNKDKNESRFLFGKNASEKAAEQHL